MAVPLPRLKRDGHGDDVDDRRIGAESQPPRRFGALPLGMRRHMREQPRGGRRRGQGGEKGAA